jgi:hypothetical protein
MRWFDDHVRSMSGRLEPVSRPHEIASESDVLFDAETFARLMRDMFPSQRSFGEFLGVGESTVAGWVKNGAFPPYAQRATYAAYLVQKYGSEIETAKRRASDPKVVRNGETYMIVQQKVDDAGIEVGEVLARDVPREKAALVFASAVPMWRLMKRALDVLDHEIETMDEEDSGWIRELKTSIIDLSFRTWNPDAARTHARDRAQMMEELANLDLNLDISVPASADAREDPDNE